MNETVEQIIERVGEKNFISDTQDEYATRVEGYYYCEFSNIRDAESTFGKDDIPEDLLNIILNGDAAIQLEADVFVKKDEAPSELEYATERHDAIRSRNLNNK